MACDEETQSPQALTRIPRIITNGFGLLRIRVNSCKFVSGLDEAVGMKMPARLPRRNGMKAGRGLRFFGFGSTKIPLLTELKTDERDAQRIHPRRLPQPQLDGQGGRARRRGAVAGGRVTRVALCLGNPPRRQHPGEVEEGLRHVKSGSLGTVTGCGVEAMKTTSGIPQIINLIFKLKHLIFS